jgi:hypothetical protein
MNLDTPHILISKIENLYNIKLNFDGYTITHNDVNGSFNYEIFLKVTKINNEIDRSLELNEKLVDVISITVGPAANKSCYLLTIKYRFHHFEELNKCIKTKSNDISQFFQLMPHYISISNALNPNSRCAYNNLTIVKKLKNYESLFDNSETDFFDDEITYHKAQYCNYFDGELINKINYNNYIADINDILNEFSLEENIDFGNLTIEEKNKIFLQHQQ